jgi:hypothetical protein
MADNPTGWQPIHTAPLGRSIQIGVAAGAPVQWGCLSATMTYTHGFVGQGEIRICPQTFERRVRIGGELVEGCTHWMPLPEAPGHG